MAIFISYARPDSEFVDRLAAHLIRDGANVWIDRWELRVGDSITSRIEAAINDASALIVVLSQASAQSDWCKREINAGLVRELEERRIVVLPLLLEECELPLFLRDKLYADFRSDFDEGLKTTLKAVAHLTSETQGRIDQGDDGHVDWALDWFQKHDEPFEMRFTFVNHGTDLPISVLTTISLTANDVATRRYLQFHEAGLGWIGRHVIIELLADFIDLNPGSLQMVLEDQFEKTKSVTVGDPRLGIRYDVSVSARWLGQETGNDLFIDPGGLLVQAREQGRRNRRPMSETDKRRMAEILASPIR